MSPLPYTHPTDCPAWVFDAALAIPLSVARAPAAAGAIKPAELAGPRARGEARASLFPNPPER